MMNLRNMPGNKDMIGALKRPPSQQECDDWLAQAKISLFRIVYPLIECADVMAAETMEWINDKKDIDNAEVRKYARWGREEMAAAVKAAQADCNTDFIEEYAGIIQDKVMPDVYNIRNEISKYLHKVKCHAAPTLCRLHTTEVLIDLARLMYQRVDDEIFKSSGGYHWVRSFPNYNPKKALHQWGRLCTVFYEHTNPEDRLIDLNKASKAKQCVQDLADHLYNSDLIDEAQEETLKEFGAI